MAIILAGDVGGTNTRLALFDVSAAGRFVQKAESVSKSASWSSLELALQHFIQQEAVQVQAACIGVAGAVKRGICHPTHLPWLVDSRELAKTLNLNAVSVVNDLEAIAYSIEILPPEQLLVLNAGDAQGVGNRAVIAAGTGLGEAGLFWDDEKQRHRPFATEGGHAGFSVTNDLEVELLQFLRAKLPAVSWESVLCGRGLFNIHSFVCAKNGLPEVPPWLAEQMARGMDPNAAISRAAQIKSDRICEEALQLYVHLLGTEASNLALKIMALGGVYIAGGIAPKIGDLLTENNAFMTAFTNHNRQRELLASMPVKLVLNDKTGLLGAANCAVIHHLA